MKGNRLLLGLLLAVSLLLGSLPMTASAEVDSAELLAGREVLAPFEDLRPDGWYAPGVAYALENHLFYGATDTLFRPNVAMTRSMAVTVLWRLAGEPVPQTQANFTDVPAGSYYAAAVSWASENGITGGVGGGRFNPAGNITREQLASLLYRYAALMHVATQERASLSGFPEESKVSSYARDALSWLLSRRVMSGVLSHGITFLEPAGVATRAQVAVIMMNFQQLVLEGGTAPGSSLVPESILYHEDTVMWLNGQRFPEVLSLEGTRYVELDQAADTLGGSVVRGVNLVLNWKGRKLYLAPAAPAFWENGRFTSLGQPVARRGGSYYVPADSFFSALGFHVLEDPRQEQVFYTSYPTNQQIPKGVNIPVLRYHAIGDGSWGTKDVFLQPELMEAHLAALNREGCTSITFEDLDRADQFYRPVLMTFDDGYRDNYTVLFPLLKKYGIKATIFLVSGQVGKDHYLTEEMIREMAASGLVSFQSHTVNHWALDDMSDAGLNFQIGTSKMEIARMTGKEPFVFSYPEARSDAAASVYVKQYYQFAVYRDGAKYRTGNDPFSIPRYGMPWGTTEADFLKAIR